MNPFFNKTFGRNIILILKIGITTFTIEIGKHNLLFEFINLPGQALDLDEYVTVVEVLDPTGDLDAPRDLLGGKAKANRLDLSRITQTAAHRTLGNRARSSLPLPWPGKAHRVFPLMTASHVTRKGAATT